LLDDRNRTVGERLPVFLLSDLLSGENKQRQTDPDSLGAVWIGLPLITGPAVLTTYMLPAGMDGILLTARRCDLGFDGPGREPSGDQVFSIAL
jgi:hypothetical protein